LDDWSYEPAPDLEKSVADRMRHFPRDPDMTIYAIRSGFQLVLRAFLRSYHRLNVRGREHLPVDEPFVMVCNHSSHLDALCLLSSLPLRRVHRAFPVAASDYFFSSLPRSILSVIFINGLPFDRESTGGQSLEVCRQLLSRPGGNILILFPEGTRSRSGTVGRFRSGIGRLVAGTRTPVVPCHLAGTYEAFPKGAVVPRPRTLRLHIGRPRTFADVSPHDRGGIESLCALLRDDVIALAG
jgi:1-acyl-sn-glycerol-3-phosphate acyltransferase